MAVKSLRFQVWTLGLSQCVISLPTYTCSLILPLQWLYMQLDWSFLMCWYVWTLYDTVPLWHFVKCVLCQSLWRGVGEFLSPLRTFAFVYEQRFALAMALIKSLMPQSIRVSLNKQMCIPEGLLLIFVSYTLFTQTRLTGFQCICNKDEL